MTMDERHGQERLGHADGVDDAGAMRALVDTFRRRVSHTVALAAEELQYASVSALTMVMLVVIASAAIILAWGLVCTALLALVAAAGYPWIAFAVGLAVVHALAAVVCWQLVLRMSRNLTLPALRAALDRQAKDI